MARSNILDGYIISIIQNNDIREQADLQSLLKEYGHDVPQATLSRRLRRLKIAKISGAYQIIDLNMPNLPIILNVQVSEFGLVVLHTHPGNANSLAYFIDQKYVNHNQRMQKKSGILGTIAGDDTVLLIIKSKPDLNKVLGLLKEEFPYLVAF